MSADAFMSASTSTPTLCFFGVQSAVFMDDFMSVGAAAPTLCSFE